MSALFLPTSIAKLLRLHFDVINTMLSEFRHAIDADCTGLSWIEPNEDKVRIMPNGLPELTKFETTPAMPGQTLCLYPLRTQKTLALTTTQDAPAGFVPCNFMIAESLNSYLASPVLGTAPKIDVLATALMHKPRRWSASDIECSKLAAATIGKQLKSSMQPDGTTIH